MGAGGVLQGPGILGKCPTGFTVVVLPCLRGQEDLLARGPVSPTG